MRSLLEQGGGFWAICFFPIKRGARGECVPIFLLQALLYEDLICGTATAILQSCGETLLRDKGGNNKKKELEWLGTLWHFWVVSQVSGHLSDKKNNNVNLCCLSHIYSVIILLAARSMLSNTISETGWLYSCGPLVSWYTNIHPSMSIMWCSTVYSILYLSYIKWSSNPFCFHLYWI